jgi:hypothetical protein
MYFTYRNFTTFCNLRNVVGINLTDRGKNPSLKEAGQVPKLKGIKFLGVGILQLFLFVKGLRPAG